MANDIKDMLLKIETVELSQQKTCLLCHGSAVPPKIDVLMLLMCTVAEELGNMQLVAGQCSSFGFAPWLPLQVPFCYFFSGGACPTRSAHKRAACETREEGVTLSL